MIATSFAESNAVMEKPPDMSAEECAALAVCRTETAEGWPLVISCWKLTKVEQELINQTGRVWLVVVGETMPPVELRVASPFVSQHGEQESS